MRRSLDTRFSVLGFSPTHSVLASLGVRSEPGFLTDMSPAGLMVKQTLMLLQTTLRWREGALLAAPSMDNIAVNKS